jgi:hypothetical protein
LLSGCRDTIEFLSDDSRRNGPNAVDVLKLASDRPKLIDRLNTLSVQHVPGKLRQIETFNGPFAGWEMTRHLLFLSLTGGAYASHDRPRGFPFGFAAAIRCIAASAWALASAL